MWPTTISVGPSAVPGTRANEEPIWSLPTSAANSLHQSRQTRAGSVSRPDGPTAVSRFSSSLGIDTSAEGYPFCGPGLRQLPQHVLQDAAVVEVALLLGRVNPHCRGELPVVRFDSDFARDLLDAGETGDRERLVRRSARVTAPNRRP